MSNEIEAFEACRQVIAAWAVHVDSGSFDEAGALFAPDGIFHRANGTTVVGAANIAIALGQRPSSVHTVHVISTPFLEFTDEHHVRGRTQFISAAVDQARGGVLELRGAGTFEDQLRCVGGRWRLVERRARLIATSTPGARP